VPGDAEQFPDVGLAGDQQRGERGGDALAGSAIAVVVSSAPADTTAAAASLAARLLLGIFTM
jgi:hypothetical protein